MTTIYIYIRTPTRLHYAARLRACKYVPLVKQNVMKLVVFILGGERRDKRERRDGGEGEERGLRKVAERG